MKLKELSIIIVAVAIVGGLLYNKFAKAKPDNIIEEAAEEVIRYETGADIDLTPDTPENK
jgi:hypothetical protein